ncbi:MAG TPA: hypothetical protein VGJ30_06565 [Candidatus Angelobacter sp.]
MAFGDPKLEISFSLETANVIDFLKSFGAQRETLRGKLEWEKAHLPQVLKVSTGRPVRGRHRPFQKARGLDREIFRAAVYILIPNCTFLGTAAVRCGFRPCFSAPVCYFQTQDFFGKKVHRGQIVTAFRRLHGMQIPCEDEHQVIGLCWT